MNTLRSESGARCKLDGLLGTKKVLIMGVLNVTPDSFSDGGRYVVFNDAIAMAGQLIADGADIIDIGGESSRPGAAVVTVEEELRRTVPVVHELVKRFPDVPVSIDTVKSKVAKECLAEGAVIVNDISALRCDTEMAGVVQEAEANVVLMHMQGEPRTMQISPHYEDVVSEISEFFRDRISYAVSCGISEEKIWLDPGIGFGKTLEHNLEILRSLDKFNDFGRPLVCGTSRKSFIGMLTDNLPPEERLEGSLASCLWAVSQGARIVRVHDVKSTRRAATVWNAITGKT